MHLAYRNIPPSPSISHSPAASAIWHTTVVDAEGKVSSEHVYIGNAPDPSRSFFSQTPMNTITVLELDHTPASRMLFFPSLLHWLHFMPLLEDLTINIDYGRIVPGPPPLNPVPFSLRRLVLSEAFRGWVYLIVRSRNTLECLSLGSRQWGGPEGTLSDCALSDAPKYADTLEGVSLSEFPRLRALRMEDTPEPRLLAACARLTSLAMRGDAPYLAVAQLALCGPLRRLTLVFLEFTDDEARALARALVEFPVFRTLRTLAVEVAHAHDDFVLDGHPGRMDLAVTCRARHIAVSVAQVRPYCDWERLDNVPQRGSG